jgi:hypothetical protein
MILSRHDSVSPPLLILTGGSKLRDADRSQFHD